MSAILGNGNITFGDATTQSTAALPLTGGTLTGAVTGTAITTSGNVTVGGNLAVNGTTTIGNAPTDAFTITSNTATINNTLTLTHDGALPNTVVDVLTLRRTSSATPAAGIGTGLAFAAETSASNNEIGATIDAVVTDATAGSEDFALVFSNMTNGAAATEKMRLDSSGNLGIGTSSPGEKLEVNGRVQAKSSSDVNLAFVLNNTAAGGREWQLIGSATGGLDGGGTFNIRDNTASVNRLTIDSSGNLGLGVAPSAWGSSVKAIQTVGASFWSSNSGNSIFTQNGYSDGTNTKYVTSNYASQYQQATGGHYWYTAPSGTAGNPISFTQAMTLDASGNLGVGKSSGLTYKATVVGDNPLQFYNAPQNAVTRFQYGASGAELLIGHYYGTGSSIAFYTAPSGGGEVERARIDSSGNLGLGVTPSAWGGAVKALDINTAGSVVASGNAFELYLNSYWSGSAFIYKNTGVASKYEQSLGAHKWYIAPSGTAGNPIPFTQAMTLDVSGNLLVGTTSPSIYDTNTGIDVGPTYYKLTCTGGDGSSNAGISLSNNVIDSQVGFWRNNTVSKRIRGAAVGSVWVSDTAGSEACAIAFYTQSGGTAVAERARIDSSGNLGLGVTPSAWGIWQGKGILQLGDTGAYVHGGGSGWSFSNFVYLGNSGYYNGTAWAYTNARDGVARYSQAGGNHMWDIAPVGTVGAAISFTQAMTLDVRGNLLVGKTTEGLVNAGFESGYGTEPSRMTRSGNAALELNRLTSTGAVVRIYYNTGDVGSISTNGTSTAYVTSSDYRLKHNIAPMQNALRRVAALKPVTYKWNADNSDGEGFIAHELAAVCPQAVTGEKDAVDADGKPVYQGIDTSFLVATLTAAIQEQQAIIEQLKRRIETLEAR